MSISLTGRDRLRCQLPLEAEGLAQRRPERDERMPGKLETGRIIRRAPVGIRSRKPGWRIQDCLGKRGHVSEMGSRVAIAVDCALRCGSRAAGWAHPLCRTSGVASTLSPAAGICATSVLSTASTGCQCRRLREQRTDDSETRKPATSGEHTKNPCLPPNCRKKHLMKIWSA